MTKRVRASAGMRYPEAGLVVRVDASGWTLVDWDYDNQQTWYRTADLSTISET